MRPAISLTSFAPSRCRVVARRNWAASLRRRGREMYAELVVQLKVTPRISFTGAGEPSASSLRVDTGSPEVFRRYVVRCSPSMASS